MRATVLLPLLVACNDKASSDTAAGSCADLFDRVAELYPDAGTPVSCTGDGARIADSIMNVRGITIDNVGEEMSPCVEVRCDADYAYIASNDLSFYDFVQITPNALVESSYVFRIPIVSAAYNAANITGDADNVETQDACVDAWNAWVRDPTDATSAEPSGLCLADSGDAPFLYAPQSGVYGQKIECLDQVAMTISGAPTFGPNEGHTPYAYGNPGYWYPTGAANDTYYEGLTTALDLCGFHTSSVGHNHAANEVCYALGEDNAPANSYVDVAEQWDMLAAIEGDCTEESAIVGWSPDGYPIKGPCVCVERADDGSCVELLRARSSWHYAGLSQWEDHAEADPDSDQLSTTEGQSCESAADCCTGSADDCEYKCVYETFQDDDDPGGSVVEKRCAIHDYSWCVHAFVDHSDVSPSEAGYVPLDLCNGYEGPDGYAYHATMTFPFFQACYRGVTQEGFNSSQLDPSEGGGGGPPTGGR